MDRSLIDLDRLERGIESALGPQLRRAFQFVLVIFAHGLLAFFVLASIHLSGYVIRSLYRGDEIRVFGLVPFGDVTHVLDILVLVIFGISMLVTAIRASHQEL